MNYIIFILHLIFSLSILIIPYLFYNNRNVIFILLILYLLIYYQWSILDNKCIVSLFQNNNNNNNNLVGKLTKLLNIKINKKIEQYIPTNLLLINSLFCLYIIYKNK